MELTIHIHPLDNPVEGEEPGMVQIGHYNRLKVLNADILQDLMPDI